MGIDSRSRAKEVAVAPTSTSPSTFLFKSFKAQASCSCLDSFSGSESDECILMCLALFYSFFSSSWILFSMVVLALAFEFSLEVVSFSEYHAHPLSISLTPSQLCQRLRLLYLQNPPSLRNGFWAEARGLDDSLIAIES